MANASEAAARGPRLSGPTTIRIRKAVADYSVYVINKSEWTITHTKIDDGSAVSINPNVPRTCERDKICQECYDDNRFSHVLTVDANRAVFDLVLVVERGNQGGETEPVRIAPDPDYPGQVICMNDDDQGLDLIQDAFAGVRHVDSDRAASGDLDFDGSFWSARRRVATSTPNSSATPALVSWVAVPGRKPLR